MEDPQIETGFLIEQQKRLIATMQARAILDPFSAQKTTDFSSCPKIYQIISAIDGLAKLSDISSPKVVEEKAAQNKEEKAAQDKERE